MNSSDRLTIDACSEARLRVKLLACVVSDRSTLHGVQEEAVHFLLKWGADFKLRDNDGMAPIDTAKHFPQILAAMHQKQVLLPSVSCDDVIAYQ